MKTSGEPTEIDTTPIQFDALKWLGQRRDGFLVVGAILYGLGYLVWSYNAWRNHLGQLPALEFQYLMSGIIPAVILGLAWATAAFFVKVRDKIFKLLQRYKFLASLTIASSFVITMASVWIPYAGSKGWINLRWTDKQILIYSFPLTLIVIYLGVVTTVAQESEQSHFLTRFLLRLYRYLVPISFCWYSFFLYLSLYPRLPQELGGPQPRCAYVDLVREDTAPSTLSALASSSSGDPATISGNKVIRSNRLDVYFSSSDYLLVRAATPSGEAGSDFGASTKDEPLYELRKEVIRAVQWCR